MTFQKAIEMCKSDNDVIVAECKSIELYNTLKRQVPHNFEEGWEYSDSRKDGLFYYYPYQRVYGHFSRGGLITEGRNLIEFSTTPTAKLLKHVRGLNGTMD